MSLEKSLREKLKIFCNGNGEPAAHPLLASVQRDRGPGRGCGRYAGLLKREGYSGRLGGLSRLQGANARGSHAFLKAPSYFVARA